EHAVSRRRHRHVPTGYVLGIGYGGCRSRYERRGTSPSLEPGDPTVARGRAVGGQAEHHRLHVPRRVLRHVVGGPDRSRGRGEVGRDEHLPLGHLQRHLAQPVREQHQVPLLETVLRQFVRKKRDHFSPPGSTSITGARRCCSSVGAWGAGIMIATFIVFGACSTAWRIRMPVRRWAWWYAAAESLFGRLASHAISKSSRVWNPS